MSGLFATAKPYRIKAAHRRRRKVAVGPIVQRYYDPGIGRFLSVDPVTAYGGDMRYFNRYWYAAGNPYKYTDPDGRVLDTIADVGFIGYSAYKLVTEPSWTNAAALGADVVGAAVPFATGLGAAVRAGAHGADAARAGSNIAENAAKGAKAEDGVVAEMGDQVAGRRVTLEASTGQRSVADVVSHDRTVTEVKSGGARLTPGQKAVQADIDAGRAVTPRGQNAEKAGLTPNQPVQMKCYDVKRC